jgi:signal transduction histidine kinase
MKRDTNSTKKPLVVGALVFSVFLAMTLFISYREFLLTKDKISVFGVVLSFLAAFVAYHRTKEPFADKKNIALRSTEFRASVEERDAISHLRKIFEDDHLTGKEIFSKVEELRRSEASIRSMLDATGVSYLLLDRDGNVMAFNKQLFSDYEKQSGRQIHAGEPFKNLLFTGQEMELENAIETVKNNHLPVEFETVLIKDAVPHFINVTVSPVESEDQLTGICITGVDLTNRKDLETGQQKMIADLTQRNIALEQFGHIISHNVRGPLTTILGLIAMLDRSPDQKDKDVIMSGLSLASGKLVDVIKDLNQILQVKRQLSEAKTEVHLDQTISDVQTSISYLIAESQTSFETDLQINDIVSVKSYISSILYNLISNSIKYAHPERHPHIRITSEKKDGNVVLHYHDNGAGIDLDAYGDKIFQLYQRMDLTKEGKGLGLFMTKAQVEALGGEISISSKPGAGTAFTITLPG